MRTFLVKLFAFVLLAGPAVAAFGPVIPTDAIVPSHKKATGKTVPDLPYKPRDVDEAPVAVSDNNLASGESTKPLEQIEWDKVPYTPFKLPELAPAPDPEME